MKRVYGREQTGDHYLSNLKLGGLVGHRKKNGMLVLLIEAAD